MEIRYLEIGFRLFEIKGSLRLLWSKKMSILAEMFFYVCSQDLMTVLMYSVFAILPIVGIAATGNLSSGCSCANSPDGGGNDEPRDIEPLKKRVTELESMSVRSIEQNEELSDIYIELANVAYDECEAIETIVMLLNRAEKILKSTLAQGEDTEIRRRLGNVYLHRAVTYNDFDELDLAIDSYNTALATFKPLDESGDGEAKYDIAGIQLNRGTIYHEKGEFLKAKTEFDESFLAFRAVEKISDLDTRYFMAKVSIAQGTLFRDMGEPLEKVVDAYNRAMRLLVELIDIGQMEHERELANVLMDRCTATYESYRLYKFESETERINKIGDVLIDVGRGIEILDRIVKADPQFDSRIDLFNAITTEGSILLDIDNFEEAIKAFDRAINEFAEFADADDPVLLLHFSSALANRAICLVKTNKFDDALIDSSESIKVLEKVQNADLGLDDEEKDLFQLQMISYYANRSNIFKAIGNKNEAAKDYENGIRIIEKLKKDFGEELSSISETYKTLKEQIDDLSDK
ncbi:MAG: tetratricopeptide repeat protein [Planctomycetaceae bacterium]|jgi:tetratricopeptide (TPR) repeat protein|nr:tetratricopeptide repeat protein [Planctomycetaceae bacterium]